MNRFCRALPFLLLAVVGTGALAQDQGAAPGATDLPPDIAKLLQNAEGKRKEAMNGRFAPILADLQQRGDGRAFYLDAVQKVSFSTGDAPQRAFSDWKIKNKDLIDDPRLPVAVQVYLLYLRGQIQHAKGDDRGAVSTFDAMFDAIRGGPQTLASFPFFKDDLFATIFFKYYDLEEGYFQEQDGYYGSPIKVEKVFKAMVLPWLEANEPESLAREWDRAIDAAGAAAQDSDKAADNFSLVEQPRLLVLKADSLKKAGRTAEAIETLKGVVQKFPEYPAFKEVAAKLVRWATGAPDPGAAGK
ncbi:MAG TPA: hypothetical protein VIM58_03740 [Candidatus Methylacidiphilales bacterium]